MKVLGGASHSDMQILLFCSIVGKGDPHFLQAVNLVIIYL